MKYFGRTSPAIVLSAPVIYSPIIPLAIIDAWVSAYQAIYFRVYRIPRVKRSDYVVFDRQHLAYLNIIGLVPCPAHPRNVAVGIGHRHGLARPSR